MGEDVNAYEDIYCGDEELEDLPSGDCSNYHNQLNSDSCSSDEILDIPPINDLKLDWKRKLDVGNALRGFLVMQDNKKQTNKKES